MTTEQLLHLYCKAGTECIPSSHLVCVMFCPPVNCSDPTRPVDGSIEPYQNTTEGAEIFFRCNPEFVPAGRMRVVCGADGRWNPDPAGIVCACEYHINLQYIQSVALCSVIKLLSN